MVYKESIYITALFAWGLMALASIKSPKRVGAIMRSFADFAAERSLAIVAHFGRDSIKSGDVGEVGTWRLDRGAWAGQRRGCRGGGSSSRAVWFVTAGITFCIRPSAASHIIPWAAQLHFFATGANSVL